MFSAAAAAAAANLFLSNKKFLGEFSLHALRPPKRTIDVCTFNVGTSASSSGAKVLSFVLAVLVRRSGYRLLGVDSAWNAELNEGELAIRT